MEQSRSSHDDRLEKRLDLVAPRLKRAVLPLFKAKGRRKPVLVGCSVAVEIRGHHFLFTARHVVDDLGMNDFSVSTPDGWIPSTGTIARTDRSSRGHDGLDAAVIRLDGNVVGDYIRANALGASDLDIPRFTGDSSFLFQMIGYPSDTVRETAPMMLSPIWFQWAGVGAKRQHYKKRGRELHTHVVVDFDRKETTNNGVQSAGPNFKGASGSGIWRMLPIGEDLQRERWALLSAIFTDYEGRTIIGCRIGVHLAIIGRHFFSSS